MSRLSKILSKRKRFPGSFPLLRLTLEIPYMAINTEIMSESLYRLEYDYVAIRWRFFKWKGEFVLYGVPR